MTFNEIRTDGKIRPIDIGNKNPEFSWNFCSENFSEQKSYKIIVRKDSDEGEIVWDSKIIEGNDCLFIKYDGNPLVSSTVYFVTVSLGLENGETIEGKTFFETALLSNDDWGGGFIGTTLNYVGNSSIVRKVYPIKEKSIKRVRAYVVGLGYHELFINGIKADDSLYNPSVSDYNKKLFYKTYDLTKLFKAGDNCFALELGYGWYGNKVARVKLFVEYEDGEIYTDVTASDGYWWVTGGAYETASIYGGEIYNANKWADKGLWKYADYKPYFNNGWMCALYQLAPSVPLVADYLEPIKVLDKYPLKNVKKINGNTSVYDFGANIAGRVRITVKGKKNSKIILKYAEDIKENGEANQLNLRSADAKDEYILKGEGEETFFQRFTYHGFRYVQIETVGKVKVLFATAEHIHNSVKQTGKFDCSNESLNALHQNVLRTEKNNLFSFMTDCPQRDERIPWLNDLTTRLYQNVHNFDMLALYKKTLEDIEETMDETGAVADTAPYIAGFRPADPVSASYLILGIFCYRYYGNKSVLYKHYDGFRKWVNCLINHMENGLLTLAYYSDWVLPNCYVEETPDKVFVSSVFLYWQMNMLSFIAGLIGNEKDKKEYKERAEELKQNINEKYYDKEKKAYIPERQGMIALSLGIGIVPEEDKDLAVKNLLDSIRAHGNHCACGNQSYRHLFYTLCEIGESKTAIDILTNKEYPGWGYMLESGATTMWERWEKEMQLEMHSFDHPMFTAFDGIFYRYFAGIQVEEDAFGCDKITISPAFNCGLEYVNCSFETVRGNIVSNWEKQGDEFKLIIEIPPTVKAKIQIDGYKAKETIEEVYTGGKYQFTFIACK